MKDWDREALRSSIRVPQFGFMFNSLSLFPLLAAGGGKMKDWDKEGSEDGGTGGDQLDGMGGSSDED